MNPVQSSFSFSIDEATLAKMKDFYGSFSEPSKSVYIDLFSRGEGVTVTIYKRNKAGKISVSFQGEKAQEEAAIWNKDAVKVASEPMISVSLRKFPLGDFAFV